MLMHLREGTPDHILFLVDSVWEKRDLYIRWPREQLLLLPGVTRPTRKSESQFHVYPPDVLDGLRQAGVPADPRSNGPAVAAYCLAIASPAETARSESQDVAGGVGPFTIYMTVDTLSGRG